MGSDRALEEVHAELGRLERKLGHVGERAMRRELLLERLEAGSADEAYALLHAALHRSERAAPRLPILRDTLLEVLREGGARRPLPYGLARELYARAAEDGDAELQRLLRSPDALERMEEPGAALPPDMGELPLGVRRALARGSDRARLERLLLDADPVVMRHLLENPRVTEADVVRVAARRPVAETSLREIARSPRWCVRPRVRRALARNPFAPVDVAARMMAALPAPELRAIRADGTLHAETRRHAAAELERRGAPSEEP